MIYAIRFSGIRVDPCSRRFSEAAGLNFQQYGLPEEIENRAQQPRVHPFSQTGKRRLLQAPNTRKTPRMHQET
ncbi:MAG: hypothetical protein EA399_12230 [Desulfovibrionales bacterium]|nr:MAG: hypothetical protein EA399_12230 [Desulfovibrionales bacterium]